MTNGFTPEELRLLKISDKAEGGGGRKPVRSREPKPPRQRPGGRQPSGMLGRLTDEQAIKLHNAGATRAQIAAAANVECVSVTRWRWLKGLSRAYKWKHLA